MIPFAHLAPSRSDWVWINHEGAKGAKGSGGRRRRRGRWRDHRSHCRRRQGRSHRRCRRCRSGRGHSGPPWRADFKGPGRNSPAIPAAKALDPRRSL